MSSVPLESAPVPDSFSLVEDLYLARPDLAETYADLADKRLVVVPFQDLAHDYAFSERLRNDGLSNGRIFSYRPSDEQIASGSIAEERDTGIAYDLSTDIIPVGEIITASLNTQLGAEKARQNLHSAFNLIGSTLLTTKELTGELPRDLTIDSICIERSGRGRAELMPPFTTTTELTAYDVVQNMKQEVKERRVVDADSGKPDFDLTPGLRTFLVDELGSLALRIRNNQIER